MLEFLLLTGRQIDGGGRRRDDVYYHDLIKAIFGG